MQTNVSPRFEELKAQAQRVMDARQHPDLHCRAVLLRLEARAKVIEQERKLADLTLQFCGLVNTTPVLVGAREEES